MKKMSKADMLMLASVIFMTISFVAEMVCYSKFGSYYDVFYGRWGKDKLEVLHYFNANFPIWLWIWLVGTILSVICNFALGMVMAFLRMIPGCFLVTAFLAAPGTIRASVMSDISLYANWLMFKVCLCGLLGVLCIMLIYGTIKSMLAKKKEVSLSE